MTSTSAALPSAAGDFHRAVLENLSDGVYFVDRQRRITYWNKGAERLTGYRADEVLEHSCKDGILNHCDAEGTVLCGKACPLLATIKDGQQREAHVFLHHRDGSRRPVCIRAAPMRREDGRIIGAIEIFHDDSALMDASERIAGLEALALTDPLTGLHNRRFAEMTLAGWIEQYARYDWPFGVLFADIDHFKRINDDYGHDVGDEVLKMAATTLRHGVRQGDIAARWGGEEFLILAANTDPAALRAVAERLRILVGRSRLTAQRRRIEVTISIGAALAAPGDSPDGIVRRADALLYESKLAGRNRITVATD
jgi:diguanylate cyclase (GGDEF)-like protein/PAS domain S-box-containing protein